MTICCVGQAAYDITAPYEGPLCSNRKYRVERSHGCPGAPALNAACLCALWGAETYLVARVGADRYGELVRADLARCGVDTRALVVDESASTSYSFIAVDDASGDRAIFNMPSTATAIDGCAAVSSMRGVEPSVILSDGHEVAASLALIEAHPDAPSVVDAGTYRPSTYEVARQVDYLVCSEDFAHQYTGAELPDLADTEACDRLLASIEAINGGIAVVTLGARGLLYRDDAGAPCHMPAFPAHAVDTTGAGDIFHGAFAFGLHAGFGLRETLLLSSMASSLSVRAMGGLTSIPSLADVCAALD